MATGASQRTRRTLKASEPDVGATSFLPQRWWQWVLVYPTLALSLASASPNWFNSVKSYFVGVPDAHEAERQAALWQKNRMCASLPSQGSQAGNVLLDATICASGDILVHAVTAEKAEIFKWLPLADVIPVPGADGGLIGTAHAATLSDHVRSALGTTAKTPVRLAMLQVVVICSRIDGGRYLHRRIQTPQGCFDEVIDTFTGSLLSRNAAPCSPQC